MAYPDTTTTIQANYIQSKQAEPMPDGAVTTAANYARALSDRAERCADRLAGLFGEGQPIQGRDAPRPVGAVNDLSHGLQSLMEQIDRVENLISRL